MVMLGTDMKVARDPEGGLKDYTKADPYAEWLKKEGVKVHEEFYFPSLAKIELGPWERKGGSGAVVHIANRHMPNDCHVVEIKPGRQVRAGASYVRAARSMWFRAGAQRRSGKTRSRRKVLSGKLGVSFRFRSMRGTKISTAAAMSRPAISP